MAYEFKTFNSILQGPLKPWLNDGLTDAKFKQDFQHLEKSYYNVQPLYDVIFPKALSFKRKYYQQIIANESVDYLNYFHDKIKHSLTDDAKTYLVHNALEKILPSKFAKILKEIQNRCYDEINVLSKNSISPHTLLQADGAFIFYLLKHSFIRIYLEIQDTYKSYYNGLLFSSEDLYQKYFYEDEPSAHIIIDAEPIKTDTKNTAITILVEDGSFTPIKGDVRDEKEGILSYDKMITNSSRFASFEEKLHSYGFIDNKYNFINDHGKKNEIAIIFHHLIGKRYFASRNFDKARTMKNTDIYKFLAYRYNVDVSKQFQTYGRDAEGVASFVEKHYWLDSLPIC